MIKNRNYVNLWYRNHVHVIPDLFTWQLNSKDSVVVRKLGKPGPFPVVENEGSGVVEAPIAPPRRDYSCENYATCLELASALNWDSFTCRGCTRDINSSLVWRAQSAKRRDDVADRLCSAAIPTIECHDNDEAPRTGGLRLVKSQ